MLLRLKSVLFLLAIMNSDMITKIKLWDNSHFTVKFVYGSGQIHLKIHM